MAPAITEGEATMPEAILSGPAWPFGTLPPHGIQQLGPHVFAYYATGYPCANSAMVIGREAALVFDANIFHYAADLKGLLEQRWPGGPVHLVLSHSHADHVDGSMYFPTARTWATQWARRRLAWWVGQDMTDRNREYVEGYPDAPRWYEEDFRLVVPEHGTEGPATIDLGGGVRVHLQPEVIAHTPGDLWARVEPDDVVLCGDLWFNDCEPWLGLGALEGSLAVLARLRAAGAAVYLPGHGRAGRIGADDKMERYARWILEHLPAARARGLTGTALTAHLREEFDRRPPVAMALAIPGFLEDAAAGAEEAALGHPRWADLPLADLP
jgi:cyclase